MFQLIVIKRRDKTTDSVRIFNDRDEAIEAMQRSIELLEKWGLLKAFTVRVEPTAN